MRKSFIFITTSLSALFFASCTNVDESVAKKPSRFWQPSDSQKQTEFVKSVQIKTDKIVGESSIVPVSDKMLAGQELDLADLVDIALENNTSTRQYWFQAKTYAAAKGQIESQYMPYVSLGMQVTRQKTRAVGLTPNSIGTYWDTGFGPSLQINWLLTDFGKRKRTHDAAKEALRAANFDYNHSIQSLILNVYTAYFNFYSAISGVKAAEMNLKDAQVSYDSSKAFLDNDTGKKQDTLRALANLKNAEYSLAKANASVEQSRAKLALVLGIEVTAELVISGDFVAPTSPDTEKQIDELVANALRERQTVLAAYARLKKSEYETAAAQNSYMPKISAVGNFVWTDYGSDRYFGTPSNDYSVGLVLSWDLFEGFNKHYQILSAKAQERLAAQQLKAEQIQIVADVWSAYYSYKSALKQLESSKSAVEASEEAYNATETAYNSGVGSLTDLLNAQNTLSLARQNKIDAETFLATSVSRLAYATGSLTMNVAPDPKD